MEIKNYNHKIEEIVKFHEIDILGVCNNAIYFNYFEDARIKYVQELSAKYKFKEFLVGNSFFIMAHNECDYIEPALFDEKLNIYTRIGFVKNSSFGFNHLVENDADKRLIAKGTGIVVHINKETKKPYPLPKEFYEAVTDFEQQVNIVRNE